MPTPLHTAPPKPIADHVFAEHDRLLRELYAAVDLRDMGLDAHTCTVVEDQRGAEARAILDEILDGSKVTSRSGRSVELILHEDGPLLETLTVLRRLDGAYMAVVWGLLDCGTRADHPVTRAQDGLLRLAHELVDRLDAKAGTEGDRAS